MSRSVKKTKVTQAPKARETGKQVIESSGSEFHPTMKAMVLGVNPLNKKS